jgi:hypothetical protein
MRIKPATDPTTIPMIASVDSDDGAGAGATGLGVSRSLGNGLWTDITKMLT